MYLWIYVSLCNVYVWIIGYTCVCMYRCMHVYECMCVCTIYGCMYNVYA